MAPLVSEGAGAFRFREVDLVVPWYEVRRVLSTTALRTEGNAQHAVQRERLRWHAEDLGEIEQRVVSVVEIRLALSLIDPAFPAEVDAAETEFAHQAIR